MTEFDTLTRLEAIGDEAMAGNIPPRWDIGGNVNGGALLAVATEGLRRITGRPDPISVTAHYLAPGARRPGGGARRGGEGGPPVRDRHRALRQGERDVLRVLGTFGDLSQMAGGYRHVSGQPPLLPPIEECVARDVAAPEVPFQEKLRLVLDPACAGFFHGAKSGTAEMQGWISFADDRPLDTLALVLIADALPPAVFHLDGVVGWVPTLELTVHVRAVPAPGPLRVRISSRFVHDGMFEEDGEYWDESGELVAQSRQLALLPRG